MKKIVILVILVSIFLLVIPSIVFSQNWYDGLIPDFIDFGLSYGFSVDGASYNIPVTSASPETVYKSSFSGIILSAHVGWAIAGSFTFTASAALNSLYIPYFAGQTFVTAGANTGTFYCTGINIGIGIRMNTEVFGPFTVFEKEKQVTVFPAFLLYMEGSVKIGYPLDTRMIDSNDEVAYYLHDSIGLGPCVEMGFVFFVTEKFGITPTASWAIIVMRPKYFFQNDVRIELSPRPAVAHSYVTVGIAFTFFLD